MKTADIVIGALLGDEGKGMMVDHLTRHYITQESTMPAVVRFSGAHQCAHTVRHHDKQHTFATFGSGTLLGAPTIYAGACLYPIAFANEYRRLFKMGLRPKIFIDHKVGMTIPVDLTLNRRSTQQREHGTTGNGVLETILRTEGSLPIYAIDVRNPKVLEHKLKQSDAFLYNEDLRKDFMNACELLSTVAEFGDAVAEANTHDQIIFEGNQGILLDHQFGFFPHVTPTCTMTRALDDRWFSAGYILTRYYMTRAYGTRHGNGPFSEGKIPLKPDVDESNKDEFWQGKFRTGPLDIDLLKSAIYLDMQTTNAYVVDSKIIMTCTDHLSNAPYFIHNGDKWQDMVDGMAELIAKETRLKVHSFGNPTWSSFTGILPAISGKIIDPPEKDKYIGKALRV